MIQETIEQRVIEQLTTYRQKQARILVLSTHSVGNGITVSRLNEDDQLQELHRKLKGLPSYMYLNKREQQLEQTANAYLTRYPAGTKSQKAAVPQKGADAEDEELLLEIREKIQKVIDARGCVVNDLDAVLERVSELQDLQAEVTRIDYILTALEEYRPDEAKLLRLMYVNGTDLQDIAKELQLTERTISRKRRTAESEYIKLAQ